jgi:hypothetical protein
MGTLWYRFLSWFTGEPVEYLRCPTKHQYLTPRFKWEGEYAEAYEECGDCGKEFYAE